MTQLEGLWLRRQPVFGIGYADSSGVDGLWRQATDGPQITDSGVSFLENLKRLKWLDLTGTLVSDEGVVSLSELGTLERLSLEHTFVTDVGAGKLLELDPTLDLVR